MTINKTYATTTNESREHCEFASTGFVYMDQVMSVRELIEEIKEEGGVSYDGSTVWLESGWTQNLETGEEINYHWHIHGVTTATRNRIMRFVNTL